MKSIGVCLTFERAAAIRRALATAGTARSWREPPAPWSAAEVIQHYGARPEKNLLDLARENGLL
jgi:hypothetical protein